MAFQLGRCFWYWFEYAFLMVATFARSQRRRKNGKHRRENRENRTVVNIFNRSIVKIQLRLPSLFILLCLTTIHHNINRKLLYIYFQHGTYFIRRWSSQSKIWIFIDMFEEGDGRRDCREIYGWDSRCHMKYYRNQLLYGRVFICYPQSQCVLAYYIFSRWVRVWHREWRKIETSYSQRYAQNSRRQISSSIYLVSRKNPTVYLSTTIFFTEYARFYSGDWLDCVDFTCEQKAAPIHQGASARYRIFYSLFGFYPWNK